MKKKKQTKLMFVKAITALVLTVLVFCASGVMTKAATAPGQVTGLKQTNASTTWVELEWTAQLMNGVKYSVQIYDNSTGQWVEKDTTSTNSKMVMGLTAGTSYRMRVQAYVTENSGKVFGAASSELEVVTLPNTSVESLKHTGSTKDSITLSWAPVPNANTYLVEYKRADVNSTAMQSVKTNQTKITLKKLKLDTEYTVQVSPGRKTSDGKFEKYNHYTSKYYVPVTPSKVKGLEVPYYWQSLGEIKVKCDRNKVADGYDWQLYTAYKGKKDKKVKTESKSTDYNYISKSVLKQHNFYKVRVRAYILDDNGKKYFSPWTSWKYTCPQPDVKLKKASKGIKVSWDKIQGADRYVIYMSTKEKSGYKKVGTAKGTSKVISKLGKQKLKSGKTYWVYVVAQNKDGKKYYSGNAGNASYRWRIKYKK
ncbi:MAG: fibronectin type III domain-containing protein [Lachnospiraceae bacterium]|nr:fibronectin type III domain-containing protein [Lachnospiraceae bacterium]